MSLELHVFIKNDIKTKTCTLFKQFSDTNNQKTLKSDGTLLIKNTYYKIKAT
jgi:hypothetical protein